MQYFLRKNEKNLRLRLTKQKGCDNMNLRKRKREVVNELFDKNKFKALIIEKGMKVKSVADEIGIDESTLYRKMEGKSEFTRKELCIIKRMFGLSDSDFKDIFFNQKLA